MAKKKSLDEMRDEAYRRQDNLASDIDELIDRVHPKSALTRWKNELTGSVKAFSAAGDGKTPSTLPAIAGGVIGVVLIGAGIAAAIALSGGDEKPSKSVKQAEAQKAKAAKQKAKEKARAAKD